MVPATSDDPPVLVKALTILRQNPFVVLLQKFLTRTCGRIDPDGFGQEENKLFPAEFSVLHRPPIAVEPFVAGDRCPRIRLAPFPGDGLIAQQFVPIVGIHRPADLSAG